MTLYGVYRESLWLSIETVTLYRESNSRWVTMSLTFLCHTYEWLIWVTENQTLYRNRDSLYSRCIHVWHDCFSCVTWSSEDIESLMYSDSHESLGCTLTYESLRVTTWVTQMYSYIWVSQGDSHESLRCTPTYESLIMSHMSHSDVLQHRSLS